MKYRESTDGSVPVVFCERLKKWLAVEEHKECEYFVAEVEDEFHDPVSFICTYSAECKKLQEDPFKPEHQGRGEPLGPDVGD
jgi:hypothetical protein